MAGSGAQDHQDTPVEAGGGAGGGAPGDGGAAGPGVVREVDLPADVDDVWDALTDAGRVDAWFGAPVEWAMEPGAPMRVGRGDDGSAPRDGRVDEVEPGRRLRYQWWPADGGGGASAVTYELEPHPGGTRLVITELPTPRATPGAALASGGGGWDVRIIGLWLGFGAGLRCRA